MVIGWERETSGVEVQVEAGEARTSRNDHHSASMMKVTGRAYGNFRESCLIRKISGVRVIRFQNGLMFDVPVTAGKQLC